VTDLVPAAYDDDLDPQEPVSPRSRGVALVLGIFGGVFGMHRFYVGRVQSGVFQLLTLGGLGIWWLYDMVIIVAGDFEDADGLAVVEWEARSRFRAGGGRRALPAREIQRLAEEMESLRGQVGELAERLDFAERMLAQQKERARLPRGE
jgi:TM2 domain-containing membrane protein YozV